MSVLYPWANLTNHFHIDHMFPKSQFTSKRIQKHGVPLTEVGFYMDNVNYLGNLQLLEELPNKEKNDSESIPKTGQLARENGVELIEGKAFEQLVGYK